MLAFRLISNGLFNLKLKTNERKKKVKVLEKCHAKEYKLTKSDIKRKAETLNKYKKKELKESWSDKDYVSKLSRDIANKYKLFENQEKQAVRRACLEERGILCDLASFVKQLLINESEMFKEAPYVSKSLENVDTFLDNPNHIPDTSMSHMLDETNCEFIEFDTPATSINGSLMGSRCNSFNSLTSSRPNSPLCIVEQNEPSERIFKRVGSIRSDKNRISNASFYGSSPITEGVSSGFINPYYTPQVTNEILYHNN